METQIILFIINSLQTILINFFIQPKLNLIFPNHQQQINDFLIFYTILINFINIFLT